MPLSESQQNQVRSHLRSKMRGPCPLCGERNWSVEQDIQFHGILDAEYKQPVEGSVFPVVSVTCDNCYYTFQLPARRLGIL